MQHVFIFGDLIVYGYLDQPTIVTTKVSQQIKWHSMYTFPAILNFLCDVFLFKCMCIFNRNEVIKFSSSSYDQSFVIFCVFEFRGKNCEHAVIKNKMINDAKEDAKVQAAKIIIDAQSSILNQKIKQKQIISPKFGLKLTFILAFHKSGKTVERRIKCPCLGTAYK